MNTPAVRTDDLRSARSAFLLVGLVAPVVITAVALVLILIWLPELPDQVVTHWGPDGPDGFGSPTGYIWMQVIVGLGIPLLLAGSVLMVVHDAWGPTARLLGAVSLGASALVGVAMAGSVAMQRGGGDGGGIGVTMAIGFSGMLVLGVLGWFLQPSVTTAPDGGRTAQLHLGPGERAAWFGTAAMGRPGVIGLIVALVVLAVTTAWVFVIDAGGGWILLGVTLLVIVLIAITLVFRVRASADGLRVRSIAGWPRWSIPASDIDDARAVQVSPMAEFGGWGVRLGVDGRMGVVLRSGEALQVTRRSGRRFVVTIDDAVTAASVLSAAAEGARS